MNNFRHIAAMKVIFFPKGRKFHVEFENAIKLPEKFHSLEDNCLWTSCIILSKVWREYMWLAVNGLKSGPKIYDPTKSHDTKLNFFDNHWTLA